MRSSPESDLGDQAIGFANNIAISPHRRALLQGMAERFYVDQSPVLITNGLSTELLCFPSDTHPSQRALLSRKIRRAMEYATGFTDIEALNMLSHLAPKTGDEVLTTALYLYFADAFSRHAPDTTFLSAMREARAEFSGEGEADKKVLLEKTHHALSLGRLEMTDHALLDEWHRDGHYHIAGRLQAGDADGMVRGAYPLLARDIRHRQSAFGLNLPISYALGNKEAVGALDAEAAYRMTEELSAAAITARIRAGEQIRESRIREIVKRDVPPQLPPPHEAYESRQILQYLADDALALLWSDGVTIAYANAPNIGPVYPKPLPGIGSEEAEKYRVGAGLRLNRFNTLFIANGSHVDPQGLPFPYDARFDSREMRLRSIAQTLNHEAFHSAEAYATPEEEQALHRSIRAVAEDLRALPSLPAPLTGPMRSINRNSLATVLDPASRLYRGYDGEDHRFEEVACNLYGIAAIHSAHLEQARPYLPSLDSALAVMNRIVANARGRSIEKYPDIPLPSSPARG